MKTMNAVGCAALVWLVVMPGLARAQQAQMPRGAGGKGGALSKGEPACFQKAGVSDSVWQQVRSIRQKTVQQAAAICQNSTLTPEQKQQQVKQAHDQAEQQIDALLTPEQLAGVKSCRAERFSAGKAGTGSPGDVCAKVGGAAKGKMQ